MFGGFLCSRSIVRAPIYGTTEVFRSPVMYLGVTTTSDYVLIALPAKHTAYASIRVIVVDMQVLTGFRWLLANKTDTRLIF